MVLLQLILKKPGEEDERRIELEFNKEELVTFIDQLKLIQKTLLDSQHDEENY